MFSCVSWYTKARFVCTLQISHPSSSIQLSATGRLLDIMYMCYEFRTTLLPGQLRQPKRSNLNVTSTPQSVNRWRHIEFSCYLHPSFSYRLPTHLLSRSDRRSDGLTWWGKSWPGEMYKLKHSYPSATLVQHCINVIQMFLFARIRGEGSH